MPDYTYANLNITYTDGLINGQRMMEAKGSATFTTPILKKPTDYYGCISRLEIDTFNIPLVVPRIVPNQSNVNMTIYNFQLQYNGVYSDPIFVEYIPSNEFAPVPSSPVGTKQDLTSTYYYIYEYETFILMWNYALQAALTSLNVNVGGGGTGVSEAPQFYFDPSLGLCLRAPKSGYAYIPNSGYAFVPNKIAILFDEDLSTFMNGLQTQKLNNGEICNNVFALYDKVVNTDPLGVYWLNTMNNISELSYWTSLVTLQVQTNMPVVSEYIQGAINSNQQSQVVSLLTDFQLDSSQNPSSYHTTLNYNKVDSIRFFEFSSDLQMYKVDVSIFWTDRFGEQYPVYLTPRTNINIKFEFILKNAFSDYYASLKLNGIKY